MSRTRPHRIVWLLLLGVLFFTPGTAEAHSIGKRVGDFYWGFLHPMTALESVFPILALGLLAGQQGVANARGMLVGFCLGLLGGAVLGMAMPDAVFVSWINVASFVVLGLLLAIAKRWHTIAVILLALTLGVFQGWGNATEMTAETGKTLFVSGLILGGYLFIAILAAFAVGLVKRGGWRAISIRVLGSWIAAIGLMVVALK